MKGGERYGLLTVTALMGLLIAKLRQQVISSTDTGRKAGVRLDV